LTGDHPSTARVIAREAGLADGEMLAGAELAELDDASVDRRLRHATVVARITRSTRYGSSSDY
jgi:Ca2+-transporting ATPase